MMSPLVTKGIIQHALTEIGMVQGLVATFAQKGRLAGVRVRVCLENLRWPFGLLALVDGVTLRTEVRTAYAR